MKAAAQVLAFAATLMVASACGPNAATPTPGQPAPGPPTPGQSAQTSATPIPIMTIPPANAQPVVDAALNDAASHLGATKDQLRVEQVEAREWPDSALGCPQPGVMYAQVVTPGFLIVISAGGKRLEYHTDSRGTVKLCRES